MRKRYKNTKIEQFDNKNAHGSVRKRQVFNKYNTTLYSNVPQSNSDIYVITQAGDRLDNLAFQYYGHPSLWWFIANVNNLNKINLEPGLRLRIPTSTTNANAY